MLVGRDDPVDLLASQAVTRVPDLVPIRYGRMLTSPFAFYRGRSARDGVRLSRAPQHRARVQLCGDAHLCNFGMFNSAERRLVFDVDDFDET